MWKSCRKQEKVIREMMSEQRRRAERRAQYFAKKFADPIQGIRIIGTSAKVYYDSAQYSINERMENLMPWQGKSENMIDRFDGRAVLDIIPVYNPKNARILSDEEQEQENDMNFERYKELIEWQRNGVTEEKAINEVATKIDQMISNTSGGAPVPTQQEESKKPAAPPGTYASVGFTYQDDDGSNDDDYDSEEEDGAQPPPPPLPPPPSSYHREDSTDDLTSGKEREINKIAEDYGITSYCRASRIDRQEILSEKQRIEDDRARKEGRKPTRRERRKEREKERDKKVNNVYSGYERRPSPTYDAYPSRSPTRKDDSDKEDEGKIEFITEISISGEGSSESLYVPTERELAMVAPKSVEVKKPVAAESKPLAASSEKFGSKSSLASSTSSSAASTTTKSKPAKPEEPKLTPQERLKMKMRAQLDKTIAKDQEQSEKKREEVVREKERKAEELRELRKKYEHSRSRSRSGSRSKSRSRSRSRDRYGRGRKSRSKSPSPKRAPRRSRSISRSRSRSRGRDVDRNKRRRSISRSRSRTPPRNSRRRYSSRSRSPPPRRR